MDNPKDANQTRVSSPPVNTFQVLGRLGSHKNPCCNTEPIADYWTWVIQGCTWKVHPCKSHDDLLSSLVEVYPKFCESIELKKHQVTGQGPDTKEQKAA